MSAQVFYRKEEKWEESACSRLPGWVGCTIDDVLDQMKRQMEHGYAIHAMSGEKYGVPAGIAGGVNVKDCQRIMAAVSPKLIERGLRLRFDARCKSSSFRYTTDEIVISPYFCNQATVFTLAHEIAHAEENKACQFEECEDVDCSTLGGHCRRFEERYFCVLNRIAYSSAATPEQRLACHRMMEEM